MAGIRETISNKQLIHLSCFDIASDLCCVLSASGWRDGESGEQWSLGTIYYTRAWGDGSCKYRDRDDLKLSCIWYFWGIHGSVRCNGMCHAHPDDGENPEERKNIRGGSHPSSYCKTYLSGSIFVWNLCDPEWSSVPGRRFLRRRDYRRRFDPLYECLWFWEDGAIFHTKDLYGDLRICTLFLLSGKELFFFHWCEPYEEPDSERYAGSDHQQRIDLTA